MGSGENLGVHGVHELIAIINKFRHCYHAAAIPNTMIDADCREQHVLRVVPLLQL